MKRYYNFDDEHKTYSNVFPYIIESKKNNYLNLKKYFCETNMRIFKTKIKSNFIWVLLKKHILKFKINSL